MVDLEHHHREFYTNTLTVTYKDKREIGKIRSQNY